VEEAPRKKLQFVSFGAFEDDLPRFRTRLDELRVARIERPPGAPNGIWFRDPDGTTIEIRIAEKSSPNEKSSFENPSAGPRVQSAPSSSKKPIVRPRRLAHMLVFTRDIPQAIKFYSRVLGLRVSDRSGDMIAFMHGIHGSDHMIAFMKSEGPGLHHLSWDVLSINDIERGRHAHGGQKLFCRLGAGPPCPRLQLFPLVRDPWGSYAEYSSDIDYTPVDHDWARGDHPPENSFYV